jgi:hypothetical protein
MRTFVPAFNKSTLGLSIALAVACGCDANHVLGSADKPDGSLSTGAAGASNGGNGGSTSTGGAGAHGAAQDAAVDEFTGGFDVATASTDAGTSRPEVGPLGPVQSWTGYVENYTFPSGSSVIHLTYATDANGNVAGQIVFGQGAPPPPATNPNVGYPPAIDSYAFFANSSPLGPLTLYIAEGYSYALDLGTLVSDRLRFDVPLNQLWAGWCALETSSTCPPLNATADPSTQTCSQDTTAAGDPMPIDCGKAVLCGRVLSPCDCSGSGPCKLSTRENSQAFDIFVTGETASGSSTLGGGTPNVHFILNAPDAGNGG